MQDQDVQIEKMEVDTDLAKYMIEKENAAIAKEKKRLSILDMMNNNLKAQSDAKQKIR